jgi:hypothetical protein
MKNDTSKSPLFELPVPEGEAAILPQSSAVTADGDATAIKKGAALSDFDLRQMDDVWLAQLGNEALLEVAKRLLHTAKLAKDRLNQTPNNSSSPLAHTAVDQ